MAWYSRLSTLHLFLLLPWIGIVIAARKAVRDNSFLWHIRAGELQLEQGSVLTTDPFSFTRSGEAWRTQSWMADLLYGWLEPMVGLDFVPWLIGLVAASTFVLIAVAAHQATGGALLPTVVVTSAAAWVAVAFLSPRPVLFSYLLLAAVAVALERPERPWTVPLLLWLWATLHGSFVLGLGLIVLVGLARRRPFASDLGISVLLVSLTAHGLGVWVTLWRFFENRPALDLITEWAPPRLTSPDLAPYLLLIAVLLWGATRGSLEVRDLFVVVPFLVFGLTATRALFPAVIVLAPYAAKALGLSESPPRSSTVSPVVTGAVAVVILALPFLITPAFAGLDEDRFPVELAEAIGDGPLFHDDIVGGYLIYAHPEIPVFVDDRAELFGEEFFREAVNTRNARPGWDEVFSEHAIGQALLQRRDGLAGLLERDGWQELAANDQYVLLAAP